MNGFLKYLGIIMIVLGAIVLFAAFATGNVNENGPLIAGAGLIVLGIIAYIVLNKCIE